MPPTDEASIPSPEKWVAFEIDNPTLAPYHRAFRVYQVALHEATALWAALIQLDESAGDKSGKDESGVDKSGPSTNAVLTLRALCQTSHDIFVARCKAAGVGMPVDIKDYFIKLEGQQIEVRI